MHRQRGFLNVYDIMLDMILYLHEMGKHEYYVCRYTYPIQSGC